MKKPGRIVVLMLVMSAVFVACQSAAVAPPPSTATPVRPTNTPTQVPPTPTFTPTATPSPTPSPTPTPVPTATPLPSPAAPEAEAGPAPGALYELVLTEEQLNQLAQEVLASQANVPVSDPYVRLEPDQIVATGRARLGFFTVDIEITAIVEVQDGRPAPEITEIKVGGRPLGEPLRSTVMGMITPYLDQLAQADLAVYFEDVQITAGRIRVVGRYK